MKNSTKFGAKVKTFIENCFKKNTFERELRRENTEISFYYLHAFLKRVLRKTFAEKMHNLLGMSDLLKYVFFFLK